MNLDDISPRAQKIIIAVAVVIVIGGIALDVYWKVLDWRTRQAIIHMSEGKR